MIEAQATHHMKGMAAFSHQQGAIISRKLARRTCAIELYTTDATDFIFRHVPPPCGDGVPFLDPHFHRGVNVAALPRLVGAAGHMMMKRH